MQEVRNILGQLPGVPSGKEFAYRGMTIRKHDEHARSRRHPAIEVFDPDGIRRARIQPEEKTSAELTMELDEIRTAWARQERAEAL
ncbi:hypothetical protein HUG10_21105 (plasmid) [Halorarum halophilum]|uniref:Uncharacterized protein n=1 Tax=Halorarum halophilum TaxID=2743090 RepID=A0A7D5GPR9_9EURY|nr:hypothetical protein [Halobaculum halophilum]QLG30087.1 hypothetical protein HUG10_21105 [Halobaculum halophilum]